MMAAASVRALTALLLFAAAAAQVVRPGFQIGTQPNGTDIVANGTQLGWLKDNPKPILAEVDFVDIYFSLADEAGQPTFMLFNVTVVQVTDMLTVDYSALRPGPPYRISIGYDNQMSLHVEFLCHANGSDTFGINVTSVNQPFDPLELWITKNCANAGNFRTGFTVLSSEFNTTTVVNGAPTGALNNVTVPVAFGSLTFDTYIENLMLGQTFLPVVVSDDLTVVQVVYQGPDLAVARPKSELPWTSFTVGFDCVGSGSARVTVQITFLKFSSPSFTFVKQCCANCGPSGRKWTPVGIFFFTIFIIGTALCLAGCAWNKFKRNASGWDIIPGAGWVRGLRSKDTSSYSAQADLEHPRPSERGYQDTL